MAGHLVNVMAEWVRARELSEQRQVDKALWADMENVLKDFVDYMEKIEDRLEMYATNCEAAGWTRRGREHEQTRYTDHSVGDVMKCRLMVGALHFVTGWSNQLKKDNDPSHNDTAMKAIMRCLVGNVFAYILAEIKCGYQWLGPDWAWHTMQEFAEGSQDPSNPISSGTCTQDIYTGIKIGKGNLQEAVKKWLQKSPKISASIKQIEQNPQCHIPWAQYKRRMQQTGQDADISSIFQETHMQGLVKQQVTKMFKTITKTVTREHRRVRNRPGGAMRSEDSAVESADEEEDDDDEEQQNAEENMKHRTGNSATPKTTNTNTKPMSPAPGPNGTDDKNKDQAQPSSTQSPAVSGTGTGGTPSPPTGQPRSDGSAAENGVTSATVPVPQPPPAAPSSPKAGDTASTEQSPGRGPGQAPGPGQQPPQQPLPPQGHAPEGTQGGQDADNAGQCTQSSTSTNTNGSGVSISLGCTPDSAWGVPSSIPPNPPDPAPGINFYAP
ncbi:hypothetical protein AK88_04624 [Plasmodium fragile]|uniref:Schizont-infected cell agglutination extracellular alpha domain-containing protein n=1 Tax=Plasmodium fragile TaxID=5857 RepID=A0A0D9QFI0_PLAFR|nr:uncharacterized protein AK88_04624 [Plasmodium fragile]KJP85754.1 hypothetical protein AK88_04624 [Plasmodium fragile]